MTEPNASPTARETCEMVLFRGCGLMILLVLLACSALSIMSQPRQSAFRGTPGQEVIVFETNRHGRLDLYVIQPDGQGETRLTYNQGQVYAAVWPFPILSASGFALTEQPRRAPHGAGVVYVSNFEPAPERGRNNPYQMYQLRLDGSPQQRVELPVYDNSTVVVSPDGAYLAYTENKQVYVAQWDGSDKRCVSCGMPNALLVDIAWSPDSQQLSFTAANIQFSHIYLVQRDGTNLRRLPSIRARHSSATWSPDGERLALVSSDPAIDIYTIRVDGSEVRQLTTTGVDRRPAWSPDGTQIVFASRRDRSRNMNHEVNHDIYVMNVDGSNQRRLTFGPGDNMEPVWVRVP
jgi:TolB protein